MSFWRANSFSRFLAASASLVLGTAVVAGCSASAQDDQVLRVPAEVATLSEAVEQANPGDLILVAPGRYEEQMLISTPDVTIRGEDRNEVIIDGGGIRPYGIVAMADGVRVENLTVTGATFYGLLFTGLHDESGPSAPTANSYEPWDPSKFPPLQRFHADHITAYNNGLYGIYAFNAQHGVIQNSYASGSADSGIYVGQCTACDILVTGNIAERNAVGFENSNASDSVMLAGNRFTNNRIGLTLLSSYQEAFTPQRGNLVVGNLIGENNAEQTPSQALGGYGTGIGISGGVANEILRNTITGNLRTGILLNNAEDLPALGNAFIDNTFDENRVDFVNASAGRTPAVDNCVSGSQSISTEPAELSDTLQLAGCDTSDASTTQSGQPATETIGGPEAPKGISFLQVATPPAQPNLAQSETYPPLPAQVTMPDTESFTTPDRDLLAEFVGIK